jgi:DNA-binding NarL/FixJ family response regulator
MTKKISCYIADDHQILLDSLTKVLELAGHEVCGRSNNGKTAVRDVLILKPDIILMDLDMPEMNGIDASKQILEEWNEAKIIMLTMHLEKSIIEKVIKLGVKGYLPKNVSTDELINAIQGVFEGNNYFSSEVTTSLVGANKMVISSTQQFIKTSSMLSDREMDVLKLIADGQTNKEIAETLFLSPHTIDTHRKNLLEKTGASNSAALIRYAIKTGLID